MRAVAVLAVCVVAVLATARVAVAHPASTAFVRIDAGDGRRVTGRVDLALVDLDAVLALDRDGDGRVTWREVVAAQPQIREYVRSRLALAVGGAACDVAIADGAIAERAEGVYWSALVSASCAGGDGDELAVDDRALFDLDARHLALLDDGDDIRVVRSGDPPVRVAIAPPMPLAAWVKAGATLSALRPDHWLFAACVIVWMVVAGVRRPIAAFAVVVACELVGAAVGTWLAAPSPHAALVVAAWATVIAAAAIATRAVDRDACTVAAALAVAHGLAYAPSAPAVGAAACVAQMIGIALGQLALSFVLAPALSFAHFARLSRLASTVCLASALALFVYRCAT